MRSNWLSNRNMNVIDDIEMTYVYNAKPNKIKQPPLGLAQQLNLSKEQFAWTCSGAMSRMGASKLSRPCRGQVRSSSKCCPIHHADLDHSQTPMRSSESWVQLSTPTLPLSSTLVAISCSFFGFKVVRNVIACISSASLGRMPEGIWGPAPVKERCHSLHLEATTVNQECQCVKICVKIYVLSVYTHLSTSHDHQLRDDAVPSGA